MRKRDRFLINQFKDQSRVNRKLFHDLAEQRKLSGLTVQDMADKMSVDVGTIEMFENGVFNPSLQMLCRYSNIVGVGIRFSFDFYERP